MTDIFTGGRWGFHTILYIIIFLFIKIVSRPFNLFSGFGKMALISIAVMAKGLLQVSLLHLFSLNMNFSSFDFLMFIISALSSGLVAPPIFYLLNSLGRLFHKAKEEFWSPL
jgi:cell shape-determining protein MreD